MGQQGGLLHPAVLAVGQEVFGTALDRGRVRMGQEDSDSLAVKQ